MSVILVTEVLLECDECNAFVRASMTKTHAMKEFRKEGWTFGKRVLCPACNGRFHEMMKEEESE